MSWKYTYHIIFDGGSIGNPGKAYGSFRIQEGRRKAAPAVRLDFGHGTNNDAEYKSLIAGLEHLHKMLKKDRIPTHDVLLHLRGDSQLVLNQVQGAWKVKNPRMRVLCDKARALLLPFGDVRYHHHDRSVSVRMLGH